MRNETKGLIILFLTMVFVFVPPAISNMNYYYALAAWAKPAIFIYLGFIVLVSWLKLAFNRECKNER